MTVLVTVVPLSATGWCERCRPGEVLVTVLVTVVPLSAAGWCERCRPGEVCVQLSGEARPDCHLPADADDPLGCGGLCRLEVEQCRRISDTAFQ